MISVYTPDQSITPFHSIYHYGHAGRTEESYFTKYVSYHLSIFKNNNFD